MAHITQLELEYPQVLQGYWLLSTGIGCILYVHSQLQLIEMTTEQKQKRKMIEVDRKRVPLRKLFHGKEIRQAAAALEEYRLKLNEAEFLYGAKITLTMDSYGECVAVAKRLETDKEFEARLERMRLAEEAKKEREARKVVEAELRAAAALERQRKQAIETMKNLMKSNNVTLDDLKV